MWSKIPLQAPSIIVLGVYSIKIYVRREGKGGHPNGLCKVFCVVSPRVDPCSSGHLCRMSWDSPKEKLHLFTALPDACSLPQSNAFHPSCVPFHSFVHPTAISGPLIPGPAALGFVDMVVSFGVCRCVRAT